MDAVKTNETYVYFYSGSPILYTCTSVKSVFACSIKIWIEPNTNSDWRNSILIEHVILITVLLHLSVELERVKKYSFPKIYRTQVI